MTLCKLRLTLRTRSTVKENERHQRLIYEHTELQEGLCFDDGLEKEKEGTRDIHNDCCLCLECDVV
jgi:hypothetical protein